jgi:hypothetical protein
MQLKDYIMQKYDKNRDQKLDIAEVFWNWINSFLISPDDETKHSENAIELRRVKRHSPQECNDGKQ